MGDEITLWSRASTATSRFTPPFSAMATFSQKATISATSVLLIASFTISA